MRFIDYLKSRKYIILLIFMCSIIHIIVLFSYKYETEPIYYASFIYLVLVIICGICDYLHKKKRCKLLAEYDSDTDMSIHMILPSKEPIEREYQNIISKLKIKELDNLNSFTQSSKESIDFYTMWVHQIKTPIAALQILLQTSPEKISGMKGELFKIERYVDIVLNYLRMEDMNQDLLLKQYYVEGMVKQAVKKYTPLFIQSKLYIKLNDLGYTVLTDEKWLVFVLEQVLSNAIKYTKTGGITISANVSMEEDDKVTQLIIEDTGVGIQAEDLPRIFERAFTGYNGRNDKKASGLGLYLCKSILDKLGHGITITSELHKGTKVTISFHENISLNNNLTKL